MKDEITLEDLFVSITSLWKYKVLIIAVTLFSFLLGLLLTINTSTDNTYRATATVYSATYGSYQKSVTGTNAIQSYSDILTSRKICERAASSLGNSTITAQTIQWMIGVGYSESQNVMNVYAYSNDPGTAIKVVNAVADSFVLEVSEITGTDAIQILDEAIISNVFRDGQKKIMLQRIVFAFAGLFLVCVCLVIKELFSDKLKTLNKCEMLAGHNILGVLPDIDN